MTRLRWGRVTGEDLRAELTLIDNSILSDERQIHATEFQLDLMRKALTRKEGPSGAAACPLEEVVAAVTLANLLNAGLPRHLHLNPVAWQRWMALKRWIYDMQHEYRMERRAVEDGEWYGADVGGEA